jgi:hypothetical protein
MKICCTCHQAKTLNNFFKNCKDCKSCNRHKCQAWRQANPVAYKCSQMLTNAKKSAARKDIDFSLTIEHLKEIATDACPALGIPLDWRHQHGISYNMNSPSLDRIDNSKGYVPGNVAIISLRANRIKCDGTAEELAAISRYVQSRIS